MTNAVLRIYIYIANTRSPVPIQPPNNDPTMNGDHTVATNEPTANPLPSDAVTCIASRLRIRDRISCALVSRGWHGAVARCREPSFPIIGDRPLIEPTTGDSPPVGSESESDRGGHPGSERRRSERIAAPEDADLTQQDVQRDAVLFATLAGRAAKDALLAHLDVIEATSARTGKNYYTILTIFCIERTGERQCCDNVLAVRTDLGGKSAQLYADLAKLCFTGIEDEHLTRCENGPVRLACAEIVIEPRLLSRALRNSERCHSMTWSLARPCDSGDGNFGRLVCELSDSEDEFFRGFAIDRPDRDRLESVWLGHSPIRKLKQTVEHRQTIHYRDTVCPHYMRAVSPTGLPRIAASRVLSTIETYRARAASHRRYPKTSAVLVTRELGDGLDREVGVGLNQGRSLKAVEWFSNREGDVGLDLDLSLDPGEHFSHRDSDTPESPLSSCAATAGTRDAPVRTDSIYSFGTKFACLFLGRAPRDAFVGLEGDLNYLEISYGGQAFRSEMSLSSDWKTSLTVGAEGWPCGFCATGNTADRPDCVMCGRPHASCGSPRPKRKEKERRLTWSCGLCTFDNAAEQSECEMCGNRSSSTQSPPLPDEDSWEKVLRALQSSTDKVV